MLAWDVYARTHLQNVLHDKGAQALIPEIGNQIIIPDFKSKERALKFGDKFWDSKN